MEPVREIYYNRDPRSEGCDFCPCCGIKADNTYACDRCWAVCAKLTKPGPAVAMRDQLYNFGVKFRAEGKLPPLLSERVATFKEASTSDATGPLKLGKFFTPTKLARRLFETCPPVMRVLEKRAEPGASPERRARILEIMWTTTMLDARERAEARAKLIFETEG